MSVESIMPPELPALTNSYSYGVRAGDTLHISGMVSFTPDGTIIGEGDVEVQLDQAMTNMKHVVEAAGGTLDNIVETTTYLVNVTDVGKVAECRKKWFTGPVQPTHTIVGVAALGRPVFLVEISATAYLGK